MEELTVQVITKNFHKHNRIVEYAISIIISLALGICVMISLGNEWAIFIGILLFAAIAYMVYGFFSLIFSLRNIKKGKVKLFVSQIADKNENQPYKRLNDKKFITFIISGKKHNAFVGYGTFSSLSANEKCYVVISSGRTFAFPYKLYTISPDNPLYEQLSEEEKEDERRKIHG
ncbi:MAG: hypothetical protein J1E39_07190 [Eubacterium sp.]|nr:hypothetical protein [Eubacterium sp.]